MGKLQNKKTIEELRTILFEKQLHTKNEIWKILYFLEEEADVPAFFYTSDSIASEMKISPPKMEVIFEKLKNKGYQAFKTHFSSTGFKTNAPLNEIKSIFIT